jgi:GT2 family glycosyltransferase
MAHLEQDGLPPVTKLDVAGLVYSGAPKCQQEDESILANPPFVSVVIATHNRTEGLAVCLERLLSLDYPAYEVIIVDNAPSTTASADFIRKNFAGSAQVRYVREDQPGLAIAHNRGLMEVKGSLVAFTDDDVIVDKHWLTELVKGFTVAENVACVTGMILPAELQTPAQGWIEQYGGFNKGFSRRIFDLFEHRLKDSLYPYTAGVFGSGANMAFRTLVLREMGGFDPALGAGSRGVGGDDLAAFFEVITRGYKLVYEPAALLYHHHRRDYLGLRKQAYGYGVGLTAYIMKTIVDKPARLLDIALKLPFGLAHLFSPKSPKNMKKQADYPKELTKIERKGMLYGPLAYLRSRWHIRQVRQHLDSVAEMVKPSPSHPHLTDEVSLQ